MLVTVGGSRISHEEIKMFARSLGDVERAVAHELPQR
jgi:hypothetical protein